MNKMINKYLFGLFIMSSISSAPYHQSHIIMSYNIRYDNNWDLKNSWLIRKNKVIQIFDQYSPSIIGVQEGVLNQVQYIDSCLTNYDYVGVGRDDGKEQGEFCVIYFDTTRYTVSRDSTFWLSEDPDTISVGWDAALERICTYALFKERKTTDQFWVFNTHFDHMGSIARERSSELILDRINRVNRRGLPVILMGDFNSVPDSPPIDKIKTEMSDALNISREEFQGPSGTFNGFDPDLPIEKRIDYIFTRNVKVLSYIHINDRLNNNRHISDHLPVMIEIQ